MIASSWWIWPRTLGDGAILKNESLYIISLGSQGVAWAQNLRDSGFQPIIAARSESPSHKRAEKLGLKSVLLEEVKGKCWILLLTPDESHLKIIQSLSNNLDKESVIIYAHGQSFVMNNFSETFPDFNHCLLAPKAIASEVRERFLLDDSLGGVYDIVATTESQKRNLEKNLLELAKAIGINRGPYPSSFKDEMTADLFSEQTILCSALPYLAKMSFEKLVERGISKELAYLECWFELKLIVDTLCKKGPVEFFKLISPTALLGGEKAREILFDKHYQLKIDKILSEIEDGTFNEVLTKTDINRLRENVLNEWSSSPLHQTHKDIGHQFFKD